MARILCVSDLHLGSNDNKEVYGSPINDKLRDSVGIDKRDLLLDSLKNLEPKVDIIIFCGDYVTGRDNGEDSEKSYDEFLELLKRIDESSDEIFPDEDIPVYNRIVITPGNHDVDRDNEGEELTVFKEKMKAYMTPYYKDTESSICENAPVYVFDKLKLMIACVSTVDNSATRNKEIVKLIQSTENQKNISKRFKNSLISYFEKNKISDIPTLTDFSRRTFANINKQLAKQGKYRDYNKIVVTHHPLLSGIEQGSTLKEYNYTVGGFKFLEQACEYDYNLFLHGHLHEFSCLEFKDYMSGGNKNELQVGVPDLVVDGPDKGVVIIDTDNKSNENQIFLMKLDSISREFKQQRHIEFKVYKQLPYTESSGMSYILTDAEIVRMIKDQKIIKNGDVRHVEAASYDCSLGYHYKRFLGSGSEEYESIDLKPENDKPAEIKIVPGETVLIYTYEEFDIPDDMVMHTSPIGTWMRRGLRAQISYFVDPGFVGEFCFPVTNESSKDIIITSQEAIISIEFVRLHKKVNRNWKDRHPDKARKRKERGE